ncbi:hypothetical protein Tco_0710886 [Tanacetum coccineum]
MCGEKSHIVIHDAGGVHPEVMEVLMSWIEKGHVTVQDIRFVTTGCFSLTLMRSYLYFVPKKSTLKSFMDSLSDYKQFTIDQRIMSNKLCYLDVILVKSTLLERDNDEGRCSAIKWKMKTLSIVPKKVLQRLENIRCHFFHGIENNERKPIWVKWSKVLASIEKGGLGVSSFFALNRAILFK